MPINTLKAALTIRGSCYFTTGVYNVLVPVAIYQLTGSLAMSGFFFLLENILKFTSYLYGGSWMKLGAAANAHGYVELGRWLSIPIFAIVYWYHGPWWGIAIASMLNQVANAFNNLLYEPRISRWGSGSPSAYAHQLKIDLLSNVLATLFTLVLSVYGVLALCFMVQSFGLYTWVKTHKALYAKDFESEALSPKPTLTAWALSESVRPLRSALSLSKKLWGVAFLSMALMWPIAIIFCNIPFFLEDGLGHAVTKDEVAWFTLVRTIVGFVALRWNIKQTEREGSWVHQHGVKVWVFLLTISLGLISVTHNWLFIFVMLTYNALVYLLIPVVRGLRQFYVPRDENRAAVTGFLIAWDSMLYIMASAVLSLGVTVSHAYVVTYIGSAVFLLIAMWLLDARAYLATMRLSFKGE